MVDDRSSRMLSRARELRRHLTPPEQRLWSRLRGGQLAGFRWRRQHPMGRYIVDFCCEEARLVVELDGDSHAEQVSYDEARTQYLARVGYKVMRVANRDVLNNTAGVLEAILSECEKRRRR